MVTKFPKDFKIPRSLVSVNGVKNSEKTKSSFGFLAASCSRSEKFLLMHMTEIRLNLLSVLILSLQVYAKIMVKFGHKI